MTHTRFISLIMAAALSLAVLAPQPARADSDTVKIIAGAAALTIIGIAIADAARDDRRYVTRHRYHDHGYAPRHNRYIRHAPRHRHHDCRCGPGHRGHGHAHR